MVVGYGTQRKRDVTTSIASVRASDLGWFINNQDYYDRYDRTKPKVYLGEFFPHHRYQMKSLANAFSGSSSSAK